MDNSYKLIENMIVEAMEDERRYRKPKPAKTETDTVQLQKRVEKFESYMKKIMEFDTTQRIGKEDGGGFGREQAELLLSNLGGSGQTYEQKLQNLQNILNGVDSNSTPAKLFTAITVAKMMNKFLYDMNQRKAGNAFEVFMAVLMGGSIEETHGPVNKRKGDKGDYDIIDLTAPTSNGRERYSLKFVTEKAFAFSGNLFNMMNEILKNGYIKYVFCIKKDQTDRKSVSLIFKSFTIDKEKFKEVNIAYLRRNKLLQKYEEGKPIAPNDSYDMYTTYETSLALFDIETIATLKIGLDNISTLLSNSVTGYTKILMDSLDNLNQTSENLTKFIYADDISSGEKASDSASRLQTSISTAVSTRKQGVN